MNFRQALQILENRALWRAGEKTSMTKRQSEQLGLICRPLLYLGQTPSTANLVIQ